MKTLYTLLLSFCLTQAFSQAPDIEWQKCYGGSNDDKVSSMIKTTDGGYVLVGSTISNDGDVSGNHGNLDVWVIKMNSSGNIQWQKSIGGSSTDVGTCIIQTSDGGYVIAGQTYSNDGDVSGNHGYQDMWVVKINSTGTILWQKTLGGSAADYAYSVVATSDGGFAIAGITFSNNGDVSGNHGVADAWIVKLNSIGAIQWQKTLGGSADSYAYSIIQTTDGGLAITGRTYSNDGDVSGNHGSSDVWIVKLNSTGTIQWQKTIGGTDNEFGLSIIQATDGGYAIVGYTNSNDGDVVGNHGGGDVWIIKLNSTGTIQWQKTYGGYYFDYANSIIQTTDGGFAIGATTYSNDGDVTGSNRVRGYYDSDFWILKLNNTGNIEWQKTLGGTKDDYGTSIIQNSNGSFLMAGSSNSNDGDVSGNHGSSDIWVVKLAPPPFAIFPASASAICQSTVSLYSQGCTGTVFWYRDVNGSGTTYESKGSGNPKLITLTNDLNQYYRAKCFINLQNISDYSNYAIIRTGPNITPSTYNVLPGQPATFTVSGCPSFTTAQWATGETTQSIVRQGAAIHSQYPAVYYAKCVGWGCNSPEGFAYLYTANITANPDNYSVNIGRPYIGNFTTNDGTLDPKQIIITSQPKYGSLSNDNNGNFVYTPFTNYKGTDFFEYEMTNGAGSFSNDAKVTLTVICPNSLPITSTLDNISSGTATWLGNDASGKITATNKITGTANVTYQAKSIELNEGFKADSGTVFKAEIGGCN